MEFQKSLPLIAEPDVLVCGCGSAGCAATVAAARRGARVMAVERWGFSGGYMTAVFGPGFDGFVDIRTGIPVVGGIAFDFVRTASSLTGGNVEDIASRRFFAGSDLRNLVENPERDPLVINVELFKLQADRFMQEAGAEVLYHTHVADAVVKGGRIDGVVVVNKGGLGLIRPKFVVDTTGDADVAAFAGAPYRMNDELQPMSLHFRVRNVRGIDGDLRGKCGAVLARAHEAGELPLYGGPWMGQIEADEVWLNATRIDGNGTDPRDITRAEMQGRRDARTMFGWWKEHLEEFRDAIFVTSGPVVGVRETRRITGQSVITREDILERRGAPDPVVMGAWYLDRHPKGKSGYHVHEVVRPYEIGYSTMVPREVENLLVAGRCHSADSPALASTRVNGTALGMGQAAGTAAALAVSSGRTAPDVDVPRLQRMLLEDGAIILERAEQALAPGDALGDRIPRSKER